MKRLLAAALLLASFGCADPDPPSLSPDRVAASESAREYLALNIPPTAVLESRQDGLHLREDTVIEIGDRRAEITRVVTEGVYIRIAEPLPPGHYNLRVSYERLLVGTDALVVTPDGQFDAGAMPDGGVQDAGVAPMDAGSDGGRRDSAMPPPDAGTGAGPPDAGAATETCNGLDDDGDSEIDEDDVCPCPRVQHGPRVYLACAERLGWTEARDECDGLGYHLVIINNSTEQDRVWSFAEAEIGAMDIWLGMDDQTDEGEYHWIDGTAAWTDGSPRGYSNWRDGDPGSRALQDCVEFDGATGGEWADNFCVSRLPYVCEARD